MTRRTWIILSNIAALLTVLGMVIAAAWLFVQLADYFKRKDFASAPAQDGPPQIDYQASTTIEYKGLALLTNPLTIPADIYSNSATYAKYATKLALVGEFGDARLVVRGTIEDGRRKFVSVNIGTESGVLNAVRQGLDSLSILESSKKGGIFADGINFSVDFFGETALATTRDEFRLERQGTKIVKFWNFVVPPPPTVVRVLIAPFGEDGVYGGARIDSLVFEYACEEGKACQADKCDDSDLFSVCLKEKFGNEAMRSWVESSK